MKLNIVIASPPEYERLVAEVYAGGRFIALVSQERGDHVFDLEYPGTDVVESMVSRKVDLDAFLEAAQDAKAALSRRDDAA